MKILLFAFASVCLGSLELSDKGTVVPMRPVIQGNIITANMFPVYSRSLFRRCDGGQSCSINLQHVALLM